MRREYLDKLPINPEAKTRNARVREIEEFYKGPHPIMKLMWEPKDPWKNFHSMYTCYYHAAKTSGLPVRVMCRDDALYVIKLSALGKSLE